MKRLILSMLACGALAVASAAEEEELPRNPFWPQGYEGTRHPISSEPRFKPQPKAEPEKNASAKPKKKPVRVSQETAAAIEARKREEAAKQAEEKLWTDARKSLDFGSTFCFSSTNGVGASIVINDRVYGVGDLVSKNVGDQRFTWSVEAISSDGKLKLKRLQHRPLTPGKNENK